MSPEEKQENLNRRDSLMIQYQDAVASGRADDAQFLMSEINKIDQKLGRSVSAPSGVDFILRLAGAGVLVGGISLALLHMLSLVGLAEKE